MANVPTVIFLQEEMKKHHEQGHPIVASFIDEIIAHVNASAKIDDAKQERWSAYFDMCWKDMEPPWIRNFEKAVMLAGVFNSYRP